ncbi:MAG TPA: hypothetical protein VLR54_04980 [Methanobacteriaceae archaeon]|nr:hypothetical protein [Methanobacteriaceae archaeon]
MPKKVDPKDKKPYCGVKPKPPAGHRFATMTECANMGQVRRYGKYKTDQRIIDMQNTAITSHNKNNIKLLDDTIFRIQNLIVKERAKSYKLRKEYPYVRDPVKKKEMSNKIKEHIAKIKEYYSQYQKVKKHRDELEKSKK